MPYAPRATLDNPYGPQITFRTEDVLPPTALYISPEDTVTVWAIVSDVTTEIYLQLRMLLPTGEVKLIPYEFEQDAAYDWNLVFSVPPVEGYILGAQICAQSPTRGECFISVMVMRGSPQSLQVAGQLLCQGYTSMINILSYPESTLSGCFDGSGTLKTIYLPNVTGTPVNFQPQPFSRWSVQNCYFELTTSAAAGNRNVFVALLDPGNVTVGLWPANFAQPPSTSYFYSFSTGGADTQAGPVVTIAGPGQIQLGPTSVIQINAFNLQSGDVFSGLAMYVEEWVGA